MEKARILRVRLLAAANGLAKPPFILQTADSAARQSKNKP
jgi:hypothetical protein